MSAKKIGRNEPCPCGSGKKYKKCHGFSNDPPEATAVPSGTPSYRSCNDLATEARALRKVGKAAEAFEKAVVVFNRGHMCGAWEDACHLMVETLLERGEIKAALPLARLVIAYNRKCPLGYYQLGEALEESGSSLPAAEAFRQSIQLSEAAGRALPPTYGHVHLAQNAVEAERLDLIEPILEEWRRQPPRDEDDRYIFSVCLAEVGQLEEAESILQDLLEKSPAGAARAPYLHELALCSMERGDLDAARRLLLEAIEVAGPEGHRSRSILSVVEARAGRFGEAVKQARRAVRDAPQKPGYRMNLAGALAQDGQYADAIEEYDRVLVEVPDHHAVRSSRAIALLESGQVDRGLEELQLLEGAGWERGIVGINIGVALARRQHEGDLEEALARHRRALADARWSNRRRAILVLNTISILTDLGDLQGAKALAEEDTRDWPAWASEELAKRVGRLVQNERNDLINHVVRVFGEDALAAMLSASAHSQRKGSVGPEHRGGSVAEGGRSLEKEVERAAGALAAAGGGSEGSGLQQEPKAEALTPEQRYRARARIGLITALPKEFAAMKAMLLSPEPFAVAGSGAGRRYVGGEIPALGGGRHAVVLTMAEMGTNIASARATLLLEHFPAVESLVMVGIAGGVPNPAKPEEHVRLGDVVVSDQKGVIQYDFDKETPSETIHRHPPRPPNARLLEAVRHLQAGEFEGERPWVKFMQLGDKLVAGGRPEEQEDRLADSSDPKKVVSHPADPDRRPGEPKVFVGPIASANKLLKNPGKRDQLRDAFGVRAIEMEASGVADATWNHDRGYLVVRGICDYCDSLKADRWQLYAAIAAAAYTRALLESMPGGQ